MSGREVRLSVPLAGADFAAALAEATGATLDLHDDGFWMVTFPPEAEDVAGQLATVGWYWLKRNAETEET